MSDMPFHQEQLNFMTQLALHRPEFLDPLFRFLNYFDTVYFFFFLIPAIWLGLSYQWGLRIFYWFTLNSLLNSLVKSLVSWPRPNTDLPEIGLFQPHSPGFPSGGAQTCFFLGGLLIYYWRTPLAWFIGLSYILLISFSRLYLGVHYPTDILGGWLIAALLLIFFIYTKEPLETYLKNRGLKFTLLLSLSLPLALAILAPYPHVFPIAGTTMGVGIGTYFSLRYHLFLPPSKHLNEGLARSIIGIATLFLFLFLWPAEQTFSKAFFVGLFMSLAASPICKWFLRRQT